jgi:PAS domain S-box-containing protein
MFEIIQLFNNDDLHKKIRVACSKISKELIVNQTAANLYFSTVDTNRRDKAYLFDKKNLEENFQRLQQLSISNYLVFVYESEDQLLGNERLERLADQYLPIAFSQAQLYTTIMLGKKALKGHAFTQLPRKLVNTSVSEIEALLNSMSYRVFWKDITGRYIACNLLFATDFGFDSIDKVIGKKDDELLEHKSVVEFTAFDQQVIKTGKLVEGIEKEIIFPTGVSRWVKITKIPHTKEGIIIGIIGKYELVNHDNASTSNKLNDQKLLQVLMDSIPDTIYFKDVDSRFIKVNKAQSDLLGLNNADEIIGKTDFDFFNEIIAKEMFVAEQQIIFDGEPQSKIEQLKLKNGQTIWMNSLKVPIKDENGTIAGTAGISRNVSELMETEHKLMAERDMLQLLIDVIPAAIYIKNCNSEFLEC